MNPVVKRINADRKWREHLSDSTDDAIHLRAAIKEIERLEAEAVLNNKTIDYLSDRVGWLFSKVSTLEAELKRRSFAFGNANLDNPNVTQQMVDDAAEEVK